MEWEVHMALYSVNAMKMYVVVVVNRTEMTLLVLRICKVQCIKHMHESDDKNMEMQRETCGQSAVRMSSQMTICVISMHSWRAFSGGYDARTAIHF